MARPFLHSFGHVPRHPAPCTVPISPRGLWCRVQTGAACPASGRVSCLAWSALVLAPPWFWHGLRCCPCCAVVPGALGAGVSTGGAYSRLPAPPGQSFDHRKNKKGSKITPTPIVNLKNSAQKQKDPYKGSEFCAILALQALKGRNLQWLKVK